MGWSRRCRREDVEAIERRVRATPKLDAEYQAYLEKFGDRCLEELKLESATLTDDPTPLLRTIGQAARRLKNGGGERKPFRPREDAEARVAAALKRRPFRGLLFHWILRNARGRIRDRENLRFERTRLFGRVRRIFVEVGRRLRSESVLRHERDIFYLTLDEILGFVEGTASDAAIGTPRRSSRGDVRRVSRDAAAAGGSVRDARRGVCRQHVRG